MKPTWESVIEAIEEIRDLERYWDGDYATTPTMELVDSVMAVAQHLRAKGEPAPTRVSPIEDGGIAMEWADGENYRHYEFMTPYLAGAFTSSPDAAPNYEEIDFKGIAMPIVPVVDRWVSLAAGVCRFAFVAVAFALATVFAWQVCGCGKAHGAEPSYRSIEHRVSAGETLVVYAGVTMPTGAEANAVRVDAIPGEPSGVYDCFRKDGEAVMVMRVSPTTTAPLPVIANTAPAMTRPRRVVVAGKYYDQYPDGHLVACST